MPYWTAHETPICPCSGQKRFKTSVRAEEVLFLDARQDLAEAVEEMIEVTLLAEQRPPGHGKSDAPICEGRALGVGTAKALSDWLR